MVLVPGASDVSASAKTDRAARRPDEAAAHKNWKVEPAMETSRSTDTRPHERFSAKPRTDGLPRCRFRL